MTGSGSDGFGGIRHIDVGEALDRGWARHFNYFPRRGRSFPDLFSPSFGLGEVADWDRIRHFNCWVLAAFIQSTPVFPPRLGWVK